MYMSTSLAHYQLPLFGLGASSSATEIGTDQRSVFLRPITAVGEATELPPSQIVEAADKKTAPMAFEQWLNTVMIYRNAAMRSETAQQQAEADQTGGTDSGSASSQEDSVSGAESGTGSGETAGTDGSSSAGGADNGSDPVAGSGGEVGAGDGSETGGPTGTETGSEDGSDGGGLLGLLFG